MTDHVVVDVEIAHTIEDTPGGWDATDKLGVAVACVWEYKGERLRVYGPEDVVALRERLLAADRVTGYNIAAFDLPLVFGLPGRQRAPGFEAKTDDLLRRIWQARNFDPDKDAGPEMYSGTGLDEIARNTLGVGKIGTGADAPKWFQSGQVQRVANYCADDVCLERDLCDFISRYGYVVFKGQPLPIGPWRGL